MNFDDIPDTQIFDGKTVDIIFPRRFKNAKIRRATKALEPSPSLLNVLQQVDEFHNTTSSPEKQDTPSSNEPSTQSQVFVFTNENIFINKTSRSDLFNQYFPESLLNFTEDELKEINELYSEIQERNKLSSEESPLPHLDSNMGDFLMDRFLKDNQSQEVESFSENIK